MLQRSRIMVAVPLNRTEETSLMSTYHSSSVDPHGLHPFPHSRIRRIATKRLLTVFDYDLLLPGDTTHQAGDLTLFYGDNGSGKTTILTMLFHVLSPGKGRGHRTQLSEIPFQSFSIYFDNQAAIELSRDTDEAGTYNVLLQWPLGDQTKFSFDPEAEGQFVPPSAERVYHKFLSALDLSVFFLTADREIFADTWEEDEDHFELRHSAQISLFEETRSIRRRKRRGDPSASSMQHAKALRRSLELAEGWIRGQVFRAGSRGADSANNIYTEILRRIASAPLAETRRAETSPESLIEKLESLKSRNAQFERFGFAAPLEVTELVRLIGQLDENNRELAAKILGPYIQTLEARLEELEELKNLTRLLVDRVNSFLRGKTLSYNLANGFSVRTPNGKILDPSRLSSGERHLLLLFCQTLASLERQSIFIIDEPELSLNVKWQRSLLRALLDIVAGRNTQFLIATHSIEILHQHDNSVVELGF